MLHVLEGLKLRFRPRLFNSSGQATCLNTTSGLSAASNHSTNQRQPAASLGRRVPNTRLQCCMTQFLSAPCSLIPPFLHVRRKPPYCSPRSLIPHCVEHALNAPTPPPGMSRSN